MSAAAALLSQFLPPPEALRPDVTDFCLGGVKGCTEGGGAATGQVGEGCLGVPELAELARRCTFTDLLPPRVGAGATATTDG